MTRRERIAVSFATEGLTEDAVAVAKVLTYMQERYFGSLEIVPLGLAEMEELGYVLKVCSSTLFSAVKDFQEEIGETVWNAGSYRAEQVQLVRTSDELFEEAKKRIEALPEERRKPNLDLLLATADMEDQDAIPVIKKLMDGFGG